MANPDKVTMRLGTMRVMVCEGDIKEFKKLGYEEAGPYHEGKGDWTEPPDAERKAEARGGSRGKKKDEEDAA